MMTLPAACAFFSRLGVVAELCYQCFFVFVAPRHRVRMTDIIGYRGDGMKASILRPFLHRGGASRRGFSLFRSFTRTVSFYQALLALAFTALVAALFHHFLATFQEVTLAVTAADEELVAMMSSYVNEGLGWLFALVCTYTAGTLALIFAAARHLQQEKSPQPNTSSH